MNGGSKPPGRPRVPVENPWLAAVAELGLELVQEEIRYRCEQLEKEPIGHLFHEVMRRRAEIRAEGREPTEDDLRRFMEEVPDIVARARAAKREG